MTDQGGFDTIEPLKDVIAKVEWAIENGVLLELDRWEINSTYSGKACIDHQKVYLDLSIVNIHWYSTHDLSYPDEKVND